MIAVTCEACGGAVAMQAGHAVPRCLFCDSASIVPMDAASLPAQPVAWLPFATDRAAADAAFRRFARASIWRPRALRRADLTLQRLLLPAWRFEGALETHWTGLVRAPTASGKAPRAGQAHATFAQVLVPASRTLSQAELSALGDFDESLRQPWVEDGADVPWEVSELSLRAASGRAHAEMQRRHVAAIEQGAPAEAGRLASLLSSVSGLQGVKASSIASGLRGETVLVPVWVGVYHFRGAPWRVLVHGQRAQVVGKAPVDRVKVAGAVVMAALAILVLLTVLGQ